MKTKKIASASNCILFSLTIACFCTRTFYSWMAYLPLVVTLLNATIYHIWNIVENFLNIIFCYVIICYPVLITYIIDLAENTLFYMSLCNLLCLLACEFLLVWYFSKKGNEMVLQKIETAVDDISQASEFNFPQPVEWEILNSFIEFISVTLKLCFQGGFVSIIPISYIFNSYTSGM